MVAVASALREQKDFYSRMIEIIDQQLEIEEQKASLPSSKIAIASSPAGKATSVQAVARPSSRIVRNSVANDRPKAVSRSASTKTAPATQYNDDFDDDGCAPAASELQLDSTILKLLRKKSYGLNDLCVALVEEGFSNDNNKNFIDSVMVSLKELIASGSVNKEGMEYSKS